MKSFYVCCAMGRVQKGGEKGVQGIRRLSRWWRRGGQEREDSGMCVESPPPAGFQGAALQEINTQPYSQCRGRPLFGPLQPPLPWRARPGGEGQGSPVGKAGEGRILAVWCF